jgi:hypothetical protein
MTATGLSLSSMALQYKIFPNHMAEINRRFKRDFRRARSLDDGSAEAGMPEIKRLVRHTGVMLMFFCVLFGAVTLLLLWLVGQFFLLPLGLSVICCMGGIFQILTGKMLLPRGYPPNAGGGERTPAANPAAYASECPNCDRKAYWTGEKMSENGRDYIGMKCSHCFNQYWLYNSDAAGL